MNKSFIVSLVLVSVLTAGLNPNPAEAQFRRRGGLGLILGAAAIGALAARAADRPRFDPYDDGYGGFGGYGGYRRGGFGGLFGGYGRRRTTIDERIIEPDGTIIERQIRRGGRRWPF